MAPHSLKKKMACLVSNRARFEVITAILKIQILWNVTPCRLFRQGATLHTTWVSRCLHSCFNVILIKARALPLTQSRGGEKKTQLALFSQRNFAQGLITIWRTLVPALIGNLAASFFFFGTIASVVQSIFHNRMQWLLLKNHNGNVDTKSWATDTIT
jgi:hypothetical protein